MFYINNNDDTGFQGQALPFVCVLQRVGRWWWLCVNGVCRDHWVWGTGGWGEFWTNKRHSLYANTHYEHNYSGLSLIWTKGGQSEYWKTNQ